MGRITLTCLVLQVVESLLPDTRYLVCVQAVAPQEEDPRSSGGPSRGMVLSLTQAVSDFTGNRLKSVFE